MNKEKLLSALESITWYNGLYEPLLEIKKRLLDKTDNNNFLRPNDIDYFNDLQFEIFWMMLVVLYGDYGTSPRSGWLEMANKNSIIAFIDEITKTGQEDEL